MARPAAVPSPTASSSIRVEHSKQPQPVKIEAAAGRVRAHEPFPLALMFGGLGGVLLLVAAALGVLALLGRRRALAETCEIAISRRDGDGAFYARALTARGKARVAATSPMFRWPGDELPNDGPVRAAYDVIAQRLAWDGWTPEDGGNGVWWERRFHRSPEPGAEVADDERLPASAR